MTFWPILLPALLWPAALEADEIQTKDGNSQPGVSLQVSGGSFDVTPNGLIALNKTGVTMRVMEAMIGSAVPRTTDTQVSGSLVAGAAVPPSATVMSAAAISTGSLAKDAWNASAVP